MDDFGILILTHGRPNNQITLKALKHHGYTGKWWLVLDDEDASADAYRQRYGEERIRIFSKAQVAQQVDSADLSPDRKVILYARVAAFSIARDLGLRYFMQLDDDYNEFAYRRERAGALRSTTMRRLDQVLEAMLDFYRQSGALTMCMSQGGDLWGLTSKWRFGLVRKAMNSFICTTDRPIPFAGRMNEDVNAYLVDGSRGQLYLSVTDVMIHQHATQQQSGGMSESYLSDGTYVKSFYTVLMAPSCVRVAHNHKLGGRWHHLISWDHAVPKIISGRHRAAGQSSAAGERHD